jgi:hypothetical protein
MDHRPLELAVRQRAGARQALLFVRCEIPRGGRRPDQAARALTGHRLTWCRQTAGGQPALVDGKAAALVPPAVGRTVFGEVELDRASRLDRAGGLCRGPGADDVVGDTEPDLVACDELDFSGDDSSVDRVRWGGHG